MNSSHTPPVHDSKTVVIFDSDCVLCSRFVRFLMKFDRREKLMFTDPSSNYFSFLVKTNQIKPPVLSVYARYNGDLLEKSNAVLHIISQLSWWGKFALILKIIPLPWRDKIYDWVAANRYQWFGKTQVCVLDEVSPKYKRRTIR